MKYTSFSSVNIDNKAFTLVEILISLTILATIFSVVFVIFFQVINGKKLSEETGEIYQNLRVIFEMMETDIRAAKMLGRDKCCFTGLDIEEGGEGMDTLSLTTLRENVMGELQTDQRYVVYEPVYIPELKSTVLYRKEGLYRGEKPDLFGQKGVDLGVNLYGVNLRYFFKKRWKDTWDSVQRNAFPQSVEIEIYLKDRFDERVRFVYLVSLEAEK